jgi:hypothetical protein
MDMEEEQLAGRNNNCVEFYAAVYSTCEKAAMGNGNLPPM